MNCPQCDTTLQTTVHIGVEINQCTTCDGVWIDKSKLDTMLSQSLLLDEQLAWHNPPKRRRKARREDDWQDSYRDAPRKKSYRRHTLKNVAEILE